LARRVSKVLCIEGAETLLADLARVTRGISPLTSWLAGLAAISEASGRTIEIVLHEPRPAALEPLLETLARFERENGQLGLPVVVLDQPLWSAVGAGARDAAGRLASKGILVPCWSEEGERCAGAGLARSAGERGARALIAAATVDLPRIARRAGAWREDGVFETLAELLGVALDGLAALRDFQRESRDPSSPRARETFAVSPVGLREALAILGDGEPREDQAGRLVAFLGEAAGRLGQARGLSIVLAPYFGERSAERFARLDAAQFRVRQPWLFAPPASAGQAEERAYSAGFEIAEESALLAVLGSSGTSSLHPASALRMLAGSPRDATRDEGARLLEAWERLHRLRGRSRGSAHALYALPALFHAVESTEVDAEPPLENLFATPVPGHHAET
jgi:hypothetical protein